MNRVVLYYSSITEPELIEDILDDEAAYLETIDFDLEIVDISKEPERAHEDGIMMTPTILLENDETVQRFQGTISQIHDLLERALERGDLIFLRTFDEAQEDAAGWGLSEADKETIEERLQDAFDIGIITDVDLERFDRDTQTGLIHVSISGDSLDGPLLRNLESYLSGIFTEIMGTVVIVEAQSHDGGYYHFHIGVDETDDMKRIGDRIKRVLD